MNNQQQTNPNTGSEQAPPKAATAKRPPSVFGSLGQLIKRMKFQYILIALSVITAVYLGIAIYFGFLTFSIYNIGLRITLILLLILWSVPLLIKFSNEKGTANKNITAFNQVKWGWKVPAGIAAVLIVVFVGLALFTTPLFIAKDYRDLAPVNQGAEVNFNEDIQNYDEMLVATVDKAMAQRLANKLLGDNNYGSQFQLGIMTMQFIKDDIYWVAPLEYNGFFEWANASKNGVPGYVLVSATDPNAKPPQFIKMNMKYVPSAYFGHDAERKMYFGNMGRVRDSRMSFEIDEEGNPHFILATLKKQFAATSADQTTGIIVLNAVTGEVKQYPNGQQPEWVDHVYPTELIMNQVGYWGKYTHGFWNTVFAKKEVNATTQGYNYCYNNGAFYLTTGITSVAADDSLVGLILANLKTKEIDFYNISGAIEQAAMTSAEGRRQDLKYKANFPTLVNFNGEPTYFMVLTDDAGLAKSYAYVNVKEYNKLAVEDTKDKAAIEYSKILGKYDKPEGLEATLTIKDIREVTVDGTTVYYIKFNSEDAKYKDKVFKANIKLNSELPFLATGAQVTITINGENILSLKVGAPTVPTGEINFVMQ